MLHGKSIYKEEAHIGEELLFDHAYELERQCMTVESTVKRKIFSMPEALEAYGVTREQFENYLAKNIKENLSTTLYIESDAIDQTMYLHVIGKVFQQVTGTGHTAQFAKISEEIRMLSDVIETEKL